MDSKSMHVVDVVTGATAKFVAPSTILAASATPEIFGHTMDEWSVIGVISAIVIGLLSIVVNVWVRFAIEKRRDEKSK